MQTLQIRNSTMEPNKNSVCKEFLHTTRDIENYKTKYYNLDAFIAVGFKINRKSAIGFMLLKVMY